MEHRHFPNSFSMLIDHSHDGNPSTADQSYIYMGRAAAPGNGSLTSPVDNILRGGVHSASQWNSRSRINEYSSSSFSTEMPHCSQAFPGTSYDPFLESSASGNLYLVPQNTVGHADPNYHDRYKVHENKSSLPDSVTSVERGPCKRKNPGLSEVHERSSSSRYSAGSSSGSSELSIALEKPTSDLHNLPSGHTSLPHHGSGSHSLAGEASFGSARRRSRFSRGANTMRIRSSNHTWYHCTSTVCSSRYHGDADITGACADETNQERHFNSLPPYHGMIRTSGTNGMSHESNQFLVGEGTPQTGGRYPESVSNRNLALPSQDLHTLPIWGAREGCSNRSQRSMPSYRTGPNYWLRHEAASGQNGLQSISETYSSRYSRSSFRGWCNSQRNGRSRIITERLQSLYGVVDANYRIGSEDLMAMDNSLLYANSRNLFDEYGDLSLDVDNMSYEELLALGERIGNVSTGLSEEMISKCLEERKNSAELNNEDGRCCICLEDYTNGDEVGKLKNCGHNYHVSCIRKWLLMKNICPICKDAALTDHLQGE